MRLIQYFSDGTIAFNWDHLPEKVRTNIELRDKLFNELQQKIPIDKVIDSKVIFEANQYVINRIKNELKI